MKILTALILISFTSPAFSATKAEILEHAKFMYETTSLSTRTRYGFCEGLATANRITDKNKKILMSLKMPIKQLMLSLVELSSRAITECTNEQEKIMLVARDKYVSVLKEYKIKYDKDEDLDYDLNHYRGAAMSYESWLNYRKLPKDILTVLERMEQLQRPFSSDPSFVLWGDK